MKKPEKIIVSYNGKLYECTEVKKQKQNRGFFGTVYTVLDTAERVAIALANLNKLRKKYDSAKLKKLKKYGKVDKNTGILTYGKLQRLKPVKPAARVKRYTVNALTKTDRG